MEQIKEILGNNRNVPKEAYKFVTRVQRLIATRRMTYEEIEKIIEGEV